MEKRMESSALTDDRSRRRRAAGCMPWRKYAVIYKSVLLESLQYAANMVMGFFSYFIFIFIFPALLHFKILFSTTTADTPESVQGRLPPASGQRKGWR